MVNRALEVIIIVLGVLLFAVFAPLRNTDPADPRSAQGANGQSSRDLQARANELQSQIDSAHVVLNDVEAEIAALQIDIAKLQRQIAQTTGDFESLQNRLSSGKKSVAALQAIRAFVRNQIKLLNLQKLNVATGSCAGGAPIRVALPSDAADCAFVGREVRIASFGSFFTVPPRGGAGACALGP